MQWFCFMQCNSWGLYCFKLTCFNRELAALCWTLVLLPQIITVEEAKRRKSVCSYYEEEEDDDTLPVLKHHSALLENMHIEQVWLEKPQVSLLALVLSLPSVGRLPSRGNANAF